MGLTISSLFQNLFSKKRMKILMLGLDGAGKTTILYKLKLGEVLTTIPTIGFNVESIDYKNISFTVWDVGGQEKIRRLWSHYYDNVDGLIFVVDCNDKERVDEAGKELLSVLREPELQNTTVLVFANKQDLPDAMTCSDLLEKLNMSLFPGTSTRQWHVQSCVATSSLGLYEGLDWLSSQLLKSHCNLD